MAYSALEAWPGFSSLKRLLQNNPTIVAFLAGGAVRDIISGADKSIKDYDIFIDGDNLETLLNGLRQCGRVCKGPYGSPRWFPDKCPDKYADFIPIKNYYNGLWQCEDILDALNQTDITINSIALSMTSQLILDPQNGIRDIKRQAIRAVRFDYPDEIVFPACPMTRPSILWNRINCLVKKTGFSPEPLTQKWLNDHIHYRDDENAFNRMFFSKGSYK